MSDTVMTDGTSQQFDLFVVITMAVSRPSYGRFTLCLTFLFRHRSAFVPSEWSVFTLSVMFLRLPEQQVTRGLRLFPANMQPTATE